MKRIQLFILIIFTCLIHGCVIVRPSADSIVSVSRIDGIGKAHVFGLRDAYWVEDNNGVNIVAYGWHPRDHETYLFFINEPSYAHLYRKIILEPIDTDSDKTVYQVKALLSGDFIPSDKNQNYKFCETYEYEGQVSVRIGKSFGSRTIKLSKLELCPKDEQMPVLLMKGKVVAKPDSNERYRHLLELELKP